ncbi:hypothetical protein [Arenibaculum sp.]|uniref:hypothetical protein n=1 Tax=Arenibaculum sp. TaxID=2865862 RepID=UPI002E150FD4|nr:hypothetical protein [Arenibaculum sp.]
MARRILIAGGTGLTGTQVARQLRATDAGVEIVLAARTPERGEALARELGNAHTARLDLTDGTGLDAVAGADLVVAALYDPAGALLHAALAAGAGHIGITTKAEDVAPAAFAALGGAPSRPIVLLGHSMAGVATMVALRAARRFRRISKVEVTALFDPRDPVGPMTGGDAEGLIARALLRRDGAWSWVHGVASGRAVVLADGSELPAYPTGLLDVPSLAAITGAPDVRVDIAAGDSLGTRGGDAPSSDVLIDLEGVLETGEPGRRRTILSDPKGLMHLTALGVATAAERVLGLDGRPPAAGGLYLPETLLDADAAIARFERTGVRILAEGAA